MRFSFYRNLTWLIGILVAFEIFLKIGINHGLVFMISDLVIVLILTFMFHRLRTSGVNSGAFDPDSISNVINTKSESEWQRKHDRWWQAHRQMTMVRPASVDVTKPTQPSQPASKADDFAQSSSSVDVSKLVHTNQKLNNRIKNLNREISMIHENQDRSQTNLKYSKWYHQVTQMKHQIDKLKSEYK